MELKIWLQLTCHFFITSYHFVWLDLWDILNFIGSFEFICSQTPANMNGMLTGVYWFIPASYINVGTIMTTIFFTIPNLDGPGCLTWMFWSLLAQFVVIFIWGWHTCSQLTGINKDNEERITAFTKSWRNIVNRC